TRRLSPTPARRRTRSAPFPYTTLFRSRGQVEQVEHLKRGERRQKHVDQHHGRVQGAPLSDPEQRQTAVLGVAQGGSLYPPVVLVDRKSTRLNSSHVAISYAVFCLNKKK